MKSIFDNRARVGSLLLILFSLFYLRYIYDIPIDTQFGETTISARTLPMGLAILMIVFSLVQFFIGEDGPSISSSVKGYQWRTTISLCVLMLVYSLVFSFLGFVISTLCFLLVGFYILGEKRWKLSLSVAFGLTLFMWGILTQLLDLYLDNGEVLRLILGEDS